MHRCEPMVVVQVLSSCAPPTLECLLGAVLPSLLAGISSRADATACTSKENGKQRSEGFPPASSNRNTAAIHAICRLAASVAVSVGEDPVRLREKLSASGLRQLGPLGKEAEVALAEAFFYGGVGSGSAQPCV